MNITHIVPHLGGGVKSVLLGWVSKDKNNSHTFLCLGFSDNEVVETCRHNNVVLISNIKYDVILNEIPKADIIIIHYWNHPLLLNFLADCSLPECRVITWLHVSGFNAPYNVPEQIVKISDRFIFTSPISCTLEVCKNYPSSNFDCIRSTGGVDKYKNVNHKEHTGFNILYVGTLDFSKLREDFIYICSQILKEISDATITICGDGCNLGEMIEIVSHLHLEDRIKFTGRIMDLIPYLEVADVFLYPLNPNHYGTGEQSLGEAMASGIVPIVFDNPCEKEIVEDNINGCIVSTIEECINSVKYLYMNKELRNKYSNQARIDAQEKYSIDKMIDRWNETFSEIVLIDKTKKEWETYFTGIYGIGTSAFLESLSKEDALLFHEYISWERKIKKIFQSNLQWQSDSKGSINHYLNYFPNDVYLKKFKNIMDENYL